MPKIFLVILVLAPFVAWDTAVYVMRNRGDTSPEHRAETLRHFTEQDLEAGRALLRRHNSLFPFYRAVFYAFFALLLFAGLGSRIEDLTLRLCGGKWASALPLFLLVLLTARTLLYLPITAYSEFVIQREAGLSTITAGLWLVDLLKTLALSLVIVSLVAYPLIFLVRTLPVLWPLPASAVVLAVSAFGIWISPWIIDPLFNRFTPLENTGLASQIRRLSADTGLPVRKVYVMDASKRSLYLNAYFTGMGNSRRVVLYDTLVKECSQPEVLSVVAHELGHWKYRHILKGFLLEVVGVLGGMWLLWLLLNSAWCRSFFGLPHSTSLVLLVLLPFLMSLAGTVTSPVVSSISRRFERQADRAALELTNDPDAFISLEKRLARRAKQDLLQSRLLHFWYGSHPQPLERIRAAENFAARHQGPSQP